MPNTFLAGGITEDNLIRGAGRLIVADVSQAFPTQITDVFDLTPGPTLYAVKTGWKDLGYTKTGIAITRNNAEETIDVDQVMGDLDSFPSNWEMNIGTSLAQMDLPTLKIAWQLGTLSPNATPSPAEDKLDMGLPSYYERKRMVVAHQRPSGMIRMFAFRQVQHMPQESTINFAKGGEQQTAPVRFRALPDTSLSDENARFGTIFDQVAP
jgi:hypothetical protein